MKKILLAVSVVALAAITMVGQTTTTSSGNLKSVYDSSYTQAEKSLPDICKTKFNNDWNSFDTTSDQFQSEIKKVVREQHSKMSNIPEAQIQQQVESAFTAALFRFKSHSGQ